MSPRIIWIIIAAILIIVEVLTQMMWALCLAIGALAAIVAALCGLAIEWQIIVMVAAAAVAYIILLPTFNKRQQRASKHTSRTGMDALLGRKAIVTHEIKPGEMGRARIDGDNWQVVAPGTDRVIKAGESVVVTAYDSIILTVEVV